MKTCATCKHWDRASQQTDWNDDSEELQVGDERRCTLIKLRSRYDDKRPVQEIGAYTQDASSYKADLWTFPNFGCSMHEETPA